ncbi:hypothetical protein COOONC_17150 [Cooperia oncophora]
MVRLVKVFFQCNSPGIKTLAQATDSDLTLGISWLCLSFEVHARKMCGQFSEVPDQRVVYRKGPVTISPMDDGVTVFPGLRRFTGLLYFPFEGKLCMAQTKKEDLLKMYSEEIAPFDDVKKVFANSFRRQSKRSRRSKGILTVYSEQSFNGAPSTDPLVGWESRVVIVTKSSMPFLLEGSLQDKNQLLPAQDLPSSRGILIMLENQIC